MKKLTTLIVFTVFTFCNSYSQRLGISAGLKKPQIKKGNIYFVYQDESPVPDIISVEVPLKGNSLALNLAVDYEGNQVSRKPYVFARVQGYLGEIAGVDLALGVGYSLPVGKKLTLLPEISALIGYNKKDLGILEVQASGSVYIQVNNTRYDNYEPLDVSLQNIYYGMRPGLSASFAISKNSYLRIHGGYLLSIGNSKIAFNGLSDNEQVEEFENLKDRNLYFDVNGKATQKAPFNANGLELRIGIFFPI